MKSNIYTWRVLCLVLALIAYGCSGDDEADDPKPDEEEVVEVPDPLYTFGTGTDSTAFEFEVVGDPTVNGNVYTFNQTDEMNGCGQIGGDYIKLDTISPIWENGFSVAAWVEFQEDRYFERIIDFGNGWGEHGGMNITFSRLARSSDLVLTSWIDSDSVTNREKGRLIARDAIVNGKSMFYAGTISPSGEMKIYINGELVAEKSDGQPVANVARNDNFIGHSNWCQEDADLKGVLSGLYIFNRPISAGEVKALYQVNNSSDSE